jgi:hypothetical protein
MSGNAATSPGNTSARVNTKTSPKPIANFTLGLENQILLASMH